MEFIDLKSQQKKIRKKIEIRIKNVLDHGQYIMGPEVFELEEKLAEYCDVKHAITCSSGTDALLLGLMAKNVGPGDVIFIPSFTFVATAEVVSLVGATPIFVDVLDDTFNINPQNLLEAITKVRQDGLNPRGIIPVDLFGLPSDYDALNLIACQHDLFILSDSAQGFGSIYKGKKSGKNGLMTATSFFPAKPLGCYGDGGAIFTDDDDLAEIIKSLRFHGKGTHKYDNVRIGLNARLDTIQAAILLEKLKVFDTELAHKELVASKYTEALKNFCITPHIPNGLKSSWAQYTIKITETDRDSVKNYLKECGVPSNVYYPLPLHLQSGYKKTTLPTSLCKSEFLASCVLSLPINGYINENDCQLVIESLRNCLTQSYHKDAV